MGWKAIPIFLVIIIPALSAGAQELYLLGGVTQETDSGHSSYNYQLEYLEGIGEHFAASFIYLNQGHLPEDHRDGESVVLWARTNRLERRLSLAAGLGPFFYYDTTYPPPNTNEHGWGTLFSAAATWYAQNRWLFRIRTDLVKAAGGFDSLSATCGIGYQLEAPSAAGPRPRASPQLYRTTENELTAYAGITLVNIQDDEQGTAAAIEYRRGFWRYLEGTVALLHEGSTGQIKRDGVPVELWLARAFLHDRLTLGLGGGAYVAVDRVRGRRKGDDEIFVAGIFSMTGGYRFGPHWQLRTCWHRTITDYDRDADVFLLGLGYRFR